MPTFAETYVYPQSYGAKGDTAYFSDGVVTSGSTTFTSAATTFSAADVGKIISIATYTTSPSTSHQTFATTIAAFVSAHVVTLAAAAPFSSTVGRGHYGTDDTTALQTAFAQAGSSASPQSLNGDGLAWSGPVVPATKIVRIAEGNFLTTAELSITGQGARVEIARNGALTMAGGRTAAAVVGSPVNKRIWGAALVNEGVIDAYFCDRGVYLRYVTSFEFSPGYIEGAKLSPFVVGDPAAAGPSQEVTIRGGSGNNKYIPSATPIIGDNDPDSVGGYLANCNDSRIYDYIPVGYRTGIRVDGSQVEIGNCHPWTARGYGPMTKAFHLKGGSLRVIGAYADTATVFSREASPYGTPYCFYNEGAGNSISNAEAYLSGSDYGGGATESTIVVYNANANILDIHGLHLGSSNLGSLKYKQVVDGGSRLAISMVRIQGLNSPAMALALGEYTVVGTFAKNWIDNPDFAIAQQGDGPFYHSTDPSLPSDKRTVRKIDRWSAWTDDLTGVRFLRRSTQSGLPSRYALEIGLVASPTGSTYVIYQKLDDNALRSLAGKTVFVRFKAKRSEGAGAWTPSVTIQQVFGTGVPSVNNFSVTLKGGPVSGDWQDYVLAVPIAPIAVGTTVGTNASLEIKINPPPTPSPPPPSGAPFVVQVAEFDMVEGAAERTFTIPHLTENQARCFRYYEVRQVSAIDGRLWIPCSPKAVAPAVAATAGTVLAGSATKDGALLEHTAQVASTVTFDSWL